jgi:hypothetical protein
VNCRNCGLQIRPAEPSDEYPPDVKWVHLLSIERGNRWCPPPYPQGPKLAEPEGGA